MEKKYLKNVIIRDLKEKDREKLKNLNFDYMLENHYKIVEKDNLFVVINKLDYETYGKERLCDVIYIEHSSRWKHCLSDISSNHVLHRH